MASRSPDPSSALAPDARHPDLSILYVDDDDALTEVVSRLLEPLVGRVHTARDGAEALRLFDRERPSAVITDLHMPGMDGLTFIEHLRARDALLPVILMTGSSEETVRRRADELCVSRFLRKPVDGPALDAAIADLALEHAWLTWDPQSPAHAAAPPRRSAPQRGT